MKIGGSISFQLIDIFNIIENPNLSEEEKKTQITEYQKSLTIPIQKSGRGIQLKKDKGQNSKRVNIDGKDIAFLVFRGCRYNVI